jgi:hypothetical protein
MPTDAPYLELAVQSWEHARDLSRRLWGFVFRGQELAAWDLATALDRGPEYRRYERWRLPAIERHVLGEFRRRVQTSLADRPADDEALDWTALLHQSGGPTRLLAFTHSFYVAAFFAVERAPGGEHSASIWAVNPLLLRTALVEQLASAWSSLPGAGPGGPEDLVDDEPALYRFLVGMPKPLRAVFPFEPRRITDRLSAQQGLYLAPLDLEATFEDNLFAAFAPTPPLGRGEEPSLYRPASAAELRLGQRAVVKIVLPGALHHDALRDLRAMNVTAATLFPGLEGFARSLAFHLGPGEDAAR